MTRKECDIFVAMLRPVRRWRLTGAAIAVVCMPTLLSGGAIRLWPTSVVTADSIQVSDLGELRGFDAETERAIAQVVVASAPEPGGSRVLHLANIRDCLARAGINLAGVTLQGATQCAVSRPGMPAAERAQPAPATGASHAGTPLHGARASTAERSLRDWIVDFFNAELAPHGGRAELTINGTMEQALTLTSPPYEFEIRRRSGETLGLVSLEVDVQSAGRTLQTVPLVAQVAMVKPTVVASRAINQSATIGPADVKVTTLTFHKLGALGSSDPATVIGQRAKKFIGPDTAIEPDMLEAAPLVLRGQLISLSSVVGGVRVVTTAKAMQNGLLGDLVRVRVSDQKDLEFDAVVVGPASVEVGSEPAAGSPRVAGGGQRR